MKLVSCSILAVLVCQAYSTNHNRRSQSHTHDHDSNDGRNYVSKVEVTPQKRNQVSEVVFKPPPEPDEEYSLGGERELVDNLLHGYSSLVRPVLNNSDAVVARLGFVLQKVDVLENEDALVVSVWPNMEWKDEFLTWTPSDYEEVTDIRIPIEAIWTPDVSLYNSAEGQTLLTAVDPLKPHHAVIYSDGTVNYIPPLVLKSTCPIRRRNSGSFSLRFDTGRKISCYLKFGSWTYHGLALDIQGTSEEADLSEYMENPCWKMDSTRIRKTVYSYDCCPEPYIDLKMVFNMTKRTGC